MTKQVARSKENSKNSEENGKKYLSQADVPAWSLEEAVRVPRAIMDEYAGSPTRPLDVAHAMKLQPSSASFRMLCGAAAAYGLTNGGYNAKSISVETLGRRIVRGDAGDLDGLAARREATLRPRVLREFLQKYDGARMPREDVALKVLEGLGVPKPALERAFNLVAEAARSARFVKEINGVQYLDLNRASIPTLETHKPEDQPSTSSEGEEPETTNACEVDSAQPVPRDAPSARHRDARERRVLVTHGTNRELIPQLKELLEFGQFEPVVSVERESVSKPVPDKVMDDMRSCGAAIIHVDADREVTTQEGSREVILNGNVLIEIGAALALYGRRFILLVQEGIRLPSNLQGLYEVRYSGEKLDGEATLRLLKAFNQFKNVPLARLL